MSRSRFGGLASAVLLLFLAQPMWAADALNFFNNWFVTGDYAVAGVGLRGTGVQGWATGKINMTGVPSNAQPIAAFLYWSTVETSSTPGATVGYFNGNQIQGHALGNPQSPNPPCWANNGTPPAGSAGFFYRADVLRFLPVNSSNIFQANGLQTVKLPDSTRGTVLYTNGASLVVIYRIFVPGDPDIAALRAVVIYDGAFTLTKNSAAMTQTVAGLYQTAANPQVRVTGVVANGQNGFSAPWSINGTTVSSNPFDGALGGRWDNPSYNISLAANASSFSTLETANNPQTCLTWGAIVTSAKVQDSDNDGLLDIWETSGLHVNTQVSPATFGTCAQYPNDPCVNLPAMGANPQKQDIFIQTDWMYADGSINGNPAHNHMPPLSSLGQVAATFALHKINVHFDVGNNYQGVQSACGNTPCSFIIPGAYAAARPLPDTANGINEATLLCPANTTCDYGNLPYPVLSFEFGFDSIRDGNGSLGISAHLSQERNWAFRYALFAHALGGPYNANGSPINPIPLSYSGIAQLPGGGFMVTFGLWNSDNPAYNLVGTPFEVANTIHHELGHTLGLMHGGLSSTPNCMPNYPSAMNYMYQIRGLTDANGNEQVDYSYGLLLPLSEKFLNTNIPMALPGLQHYEIRYYGPLAPGAPSTQSVQVHCDGTPITNGETLVKLQGPKVATPDWSNGNVALGKSIPPVDLNNQGTLGQVFYDQPDWFVLNLQQIGSAPYFGGLSVGAKASDSGAKATDAGAKASDSGAKATDAGAFPNTGVSYSSSGGAVATDSGAKATDAGELDSETVQCSGMPPPTQVTASLGTNQNGVGNSIVVTLAPPQTGSNLTYNVYRCAGAGCSITQSTPIFKSFAPGQYTITPSMVAPFAMVSFTADTVNDTTHGGTACPAADTCPNTFYVYLVTAQATLMCGATNGTVASAITDSTQTSAIQVPEQFVVPTSTTVTYDGNPHTVTFQIFGNVSGALTPAQVTCTTQRNANAPNASYQVSGTGVNGQITCSNATAPTPATEGVIYVASGSSYTDGAGVHTGGTLTINKRPITVTAAANSKTYDGSTSAAAIPTITTGSLGTGDAANFTETYALSPAYVGTGLTLTPAGTVTDGNSGNNYAYTFTSTQNGVIVTRPVTATLTAQNKVYNRTTAEPNASMSCALSNTVAGDGVACGASNGTFNSNQVTAATTVNATATLSGAQAANYTLGAAGTAVNSTAVNASANITTLPLTATLTSAPPKVYDGTTTETNSMTCSVATVISPDGVTCAATNGTFNTSQVTTANLVTATATIGGAAASNYTLGAGGTTVSVPSASVSVASSITTRPVTSTLTAQNKPYDGTNTEPNGNLSCSLNNIVAGDTNVTCSASNGTFNSTQVVGATTVSATATLGGSTATDYTFGAAGTAVNTTTPQITASANITTLPLTATLNAPSKVFDGTTTETNPMTCSVATVISTDSLTCTATNGNFNTSQVATANSVTATVAISGTPVSNYTLGAGLTTVSVPSASMSGSSSISQAPSTTTVTCPPGPYFYTGLPQTPCSATVTGAGSLSLTPTPSYGNNTHAGQATASYTFAGDANHTGSNGSANFTISPVPLSIVASSASLTYGSPVPPITAGFSGFVPDENASVLTTPPSCGTAYTPTSPSSAPPYPTYPTTCMGAAAANYTIGYMPGSITVGQAPLQITASSATIAAGAPVPTITSGYSGFVNTENSANLTTQPTCSTTYTVNSPDSPPTYPTTCSGAVANNYNISYVGGTVTVTGINPLTLNTARENHTATLLNNGLVLIAGGDQGGNINNTVLSSAELYNPANGTFTPTGPLNTARTQHTATVLSDGTVLIAGGGNASLGNGSGLLASAELYNPASGTFTTLTNGLNTPRSGATATLLNDGTILIAGGCCAAGNGLPSAEIYNPALQTFTATTGPLNTGRYFHTATLLENGQVLIASGCSAVSCTDPSAELYNPAAGTFAYTGPLNTGRNNFAATLLNTGQVLIAGGDGASGELASAELYDPVAGSFSYTGSLTPTAYFTATPLYNGTVLIAGGDAGAGNELYDPAGSFSAAGSLNTARVNTTATLLESGTVLIAGGLALDGVTVLSSAEIYTPATIGIATTVNNPPTDGATITNVVLSGSGSVSPANNVLLTFVSGAAATIPVGVSFSYSIADSVCTGCVEQIAVGLNSDPGPQFCTPNGGAQQPGPLSANFTINVPNIPGRYYIGIDRTEEFSCVTTWPPGYTPGPAQDIGVVVVLP